MTGIRFIVCGGRNYANRAMITRVLLRATSGATSGAVLVHGDALGADTLAAEIWDSWGGVTEPHPANWAKYGKSAGPIRNREMASLGAHFLIAFPGGRGTDDMIKAAVEANIPVLKVAGGTCD